MILVHRIIKLRMKIWRKRKQIDQGLIYVSCSPNFPGIRQGKSLPLYSNVYVLPNLSCSSSKFKKDTIINICQCRSLKVVQVKLGSDNYQANVSQTLYSLQKNKEAQASALSTQSDAVQVSLGIQYSFSHVVFVFLSFDNTPSIMSTTLSSIRVCTCQQFKFFLT